MLVFRGALVAAEDRSDYDHGSSLSAAEQQVIRGGHTLPTTTDSSVPVVAVVNAGRWLVPCPSCYSAQLASREDPRFYCVECGNPSVGGAWLTVSWPEAANEGEALLTMRPDPRTRGWLATETVADLLAENEQHGVM
jgi:hypothetical protein